MEYVFVIVFRLDHVSVTSRLPIAPAILSVFFCCCSIYACMQKLSELTNPHGLVVILANKLFDLYKLRKQLFRFVNFTFY